MNFVEFGNALMEGLKLAHPPIGLAFLEEPPTGIAHIHPSAPAACAFWKAAETSLFYATAEDHYNCPIGAITQGFQPPPSVMQQAMDLIGQMGKLQYFQAAEVGNVPAVEKPHQVVVYGPLTSFKDFTPDVALIFCSPYQAMLLSEAAGAAVWRGAGTESHIFGRPACAVIPSAIKESATASSLACMGARTFAGLGDHEMIVAIPAARLAQLDEGFSTTLRANSEMRSYYSNKASRFASV